MACALEEAQGLTFRHRKAEMWGEEGVNYITWTGSWELSESGGGAVARAIDLSHETRCYGKAAETNPGNRGRLRRGAARFGPSWRLKMGLFFGAPR